MGTTNSELLKLKNKLEHAMAAKAEAEERIDRILLDMKDEESKPFKCSEWWVESDGYGRRIEGDRCRSIANYDLKRKLFRVIKPPHKMEVIKYLEANEWLNNMVTATTTMFEDLGIWEKDSQ